MNEVKTPKKPLIYYYSIVMLVLLLMNLFITRASKTWTTARS